MDRLRAVAEAEDHLLPRERNPDRALQADGGHRGQEQLILRPQPATEGAADEGRQDPHLVLGEAEDIAHVVVAVLRALRLVVDGQAPSSSQTAVLPKHSMGLWCSMGVR